MFQNNMLPYDEEELSSTSFDVSGGAVGLGGHLVTCSPRDPRFASLNPTEVDGFFQDLKIPSTSSPRWTLSRGSRV